MKLLPNKKVLIVSHNPLSLHSNNGKTLNSIFCRWTPDRCAQLFFNSEVPESKNISNFFRLSDLDIIDVFLWRTHRQECGTAVQAEHRNEINLNAEINGKAGNFLKFIRQYETFKLILRDLLFGLGYWRSEKLFKWIKHFSPEVVFFVGGNSFFSFSIALQLSKMFDIPLDIYITDDYVINTTGKNFFQLWRQKKLRSIYSNAFINSRNVFVIGDDMAAVFTLEFRRKFIPLMNSVEIPLLHNSDFIKTHGRKCLDIVYAGGLHLGRCKSLVQFGKILQKLYQEHGIKSQITVYSLASIDKKIKHQFEEAGICFGGGLLHHEIHGRLRSADIVLHIESFDDKYIGLTKFSVSTKIPEYLSSGVCLIGYGPSSLSSIRLISENRIGVALTENDTEDESLFKLYSILISAENRQYFALAGYRFAVQKFSNCVVLNKFIKVINE